MVQMNRRRNIFKSMAFVLAILSVWTFVAPFLAESLIVEKPLHQAEVILVLAGSSAYLERTHMAALIYKAGVAPKVILTNDGGAAGWSQEEQRNRPYVELARRELVAQGVPDEAIEILPLEVSGTIMEARLLGKKAAERRWKSLLIVTSAYHTRRALRTFENVFAEKGVETEIGIVAARTGQQTPPALYWWLTWKGWRDVAGEYMKSVFYYVNY
jgi:uncharacterized SAM-binding protein YcdF (DUF218 family)